MASLHIKKVNNIGMLLKIIKVKCSFWQSPNKAKERLGEIW